MCAVPNSSAYCRPIAGNIITTMAKRIRLTVGALTATPQDGGRFTFFLSQEGGDRCIVVSLDPPQMHTMLQNFKESDSGDSFTIHSVFEKLLKSYRIELMEIEVSHDDNLNEFYSDLIFFDGEKEVKERLSVADGIILAKKFAAPLYISKYLMDKWGVKVDLPEMEIMKRGMADELDFLEEKLQQAVETEDYERAAIINKEIEKLRKSKGKKDK